MKNRDLAADYVRRAIVRTRALDVLFDAESWADVVRESQEIVELTLKALLRVSGIDAPPIHDVSSVMLAERDRLPASVNTHIDELARISKHLRRDRELAFTGSEDLTPSDFYSREDAKSAREMAAWTVDHVRECVLNA